jgi:hypothetical protein
MTYIQGALVSGASAHVLDRVLRSPNVRGVLGNLPPSLRSEVEATARAISIAAAAYEALPVSPQRSGDAAIGETAAGWAAQEWVSTREAAELLGVSRRRGCCVTGDEYAQKRAQRPVWAGSEVTCGWTDLLCEVGPPGRKPCGRQLRAPGSVRRWPIPGSADSGTVG